MVWDICMIHGVFIPLLNDLKRKSIVCGWSATGPICSKACFHKNRMMIENVTNRFLVPKNLYNQIFRSFRLLVQDLRSFYGFFEKISTAIISVSVFRCSRFTENRSSPTVFKISTCVLRHSTHN